MAIDLFNKTSNNYIQADLPTCPGDSDATIFEFLPGQQIGVVQGSDTLMAMDFSDFSQDVTGWVQQKRILESGEVTFIPGLTKGISSETEIFPITSFVPTASTGYYMAIDFSIGVYKNFKWTEYEIDTSANYDLGIDIASAINLALADAPVSITVAYDDVSTFTFSGDEGYSFDVSTFTLSRTDIPQLGTELLDASNWTISSSCWTGSWTDGFSRDPSHFDLGDTSTLLNSLVAQVGDTYHITYDISTQLTGSIDVSFGGQSDVSIANGETWIITATTVDSLIITPSIDLSVGYVNFSIKPFNDVSTCILIKDEVASVPAFKYPNTGMLGYLLNMTYPISITDDYRKYVNINHVPDNLNIIDPDTQLSIFNKKVDVGMNGTSTSDIMSAGDYLNYVDIASQWEKVGAFRSWLTAEDPTDSNTENLITGFYVFNPQTFAIQIEYIVIL